MEPGDTVLKKMYQSNTYRKDWPHFDDDPRVQENQQLKDQQSCIFTFVARLTIPSSNQGRQPRCDNIISYMDVWWIYKIIEQREEKDT